MEKSFIRPKIENKNYSMISLYFQKSLEVGLALVSCITPFKLAQSRGLKRPIRLNTYLRIQYHGLIFVLFLVISSRTLMMTTWISRPLNNPRHFALQILIWLHSKQYDECCHCPQTGYT